ncbi:hypothetical protein AgCh_007664 [Apium graveolens]
MTWKLREVGKEDDDGPNYKDGTDLFTIKIHGGGHFDGVSGAYISGNFRYVDDCDIDEMSLLKLDSMLEEAFGIIGYIDKFYKVSHMEDVFTRVDSDGDVLKMCSKVDLSRLVYVYGVTIDLEPTQTYCPSQVDVNYEYFDNMNPLEREEIEQLLLLEGLANEMNEVDENVLSENDNLVVEPQLINDGEEGSFHDDSSHVDSEDDEVCQARERRNNVKEGTKDDANRGYQSLTDEIVSDIGDNDYNSEDERMAANSIDEECVTYPVFNERTDMKDPKFELGMLFSSAQSFRAAVQKFAIVNRKPVFQCRNFGRRIKYKCKGEGFGRAKRKALEVIKGHHVKQYSQLWDYVNAVKKAMPDSTIELVLDEPEADSVGRRFKRIYVCLGPLRRGFTQVEAENSETWNWFLNLLAYDVNIINSGGWTFISDRQKGLINALTTVVPNAEHRSTTEFMFNKHMSELKKLSKKCYDWLIEKPMSWSRAAFRTTFSSDMFVNNHCEVYNNNIREYRDLPVIGLLMGLQKSAMRRIQNRRDKMAKSYAGNPICPC